ncbi:MAG: hypothetical protein AAB426_05870, partial [Myxococcota bacterium]
MTSPLMLSATFTLGGTSGSGVSFAGLSLAPPPQPRGPNGTPIGPDDGRSAAQTLGWAVLGTIGTGMLLRGLAAPKQSLWQPKEMLLDAAVGLQLGAGLVGGPRAESFFLGGLYSMPLQYLNHRADPSWDWRVGVLSQGLVRMARDEAGGNPVPFQGYRLDATKTAGSPGSVQLDAMELLGNVAADVVG